MHFLQLVTKQTEDTAPIIVSDDLLLITVHNELATKQIEDQPLVSMCNDSIELLMPATDSMVTKYIHCFLFYFNIDSIEFLA